MWQLPTTTPPKPALFQGHVACKPKLPQPADDYRLAISPRNSFHLSKVSPMDFTKAITIRIDKEQNVLIVSTPSLATAAALNSTKKLTVGNNTFEVSSFGVSPDNSCKGVNCTPHGVQDAIVAPNHELLISEGWETPTPFVLMLKAKKVPFTIYVAGVIMRCYLYKRIVAYSYTCHKVGHIADLCPNPLKTPKYKTCGYQLTSKQHECFPKCLLYSGAHSKTSKACPL
ncbi:hypothetical protein HPB48_027071 [Haemaphysalis longicornis]|uniref:Uncharacterized protein n=1 Tax=Haemaphysalis longicornis TaxID=44386 RepID=A0A9J6HD15_HAELO|nr:hypothetical protein HPB48_027071 [Haemaphysalis longicornis]